MMTRLAALFLVFLTTAYADVDAALRAYDVGDFQSAMREALPLAQQGDPKAQALIGRLYQGGRGVPHDYGEALKWFRKAAEQGNAVAQYAVGHMYANGQGVPKDYGEAVKWYLKASEQGEENAKKALAQLSEVSQPPKPKIEGVTGGSLLWTDVTGRLRSGEYSFTLSNNRSDAIKNVACQVVFYDNAGKPIETDLVRYEGIIPAGLSKRLTSKVDPSVLDLTTKQTGFGFLRQPYTRIEYRVVDFEIVR